MTYGNESEGQVRNCDPGEHADVLILFYAEDGRDLSCQRLSDPVGVM
jgi:hypothetical protein